MKSKTVANLNNVLNDAHNKRGRHVPSNDRLWVKSLMHQENKGVELDAHDIKKCDALWDEFSSEWQQDPVELKTYAITNRETGETRIRVGTSFTECVQELEWPLPGCYYEIVEGSD